MKGEVIAMLITGLAGGFGHCIGMCGPIVATYSLSETRTGFLHHLLYNLGRITTYVLLGALAGITGSMLLLAASIEPLQRAILILTGFFILLTGLATTGWIPFLKPATSCPRPFGFMKHLQPLIRGPRSIGTYYPMGIALGFLPCGLTYTALLASARAAMDSGNHLEGMLEGALMMLMFGLGTTPALLLLGKVLRHIEEELRERFYRLAGLVMAATGIYFMFTAF